MEPPTPWQPRQTTTLLAVIAETLPPAQYGKLVLVKKGKFAGRPICRGKETTHITLCGTTTTDVVIGGRLPK